MFSKKKPSVAVGATVTFHFWTQGRLESCPATVTAVKDVDDGPQEVELVVDFPEEVMIREGYVREQSASRQRTRPDDDIHVSGTWTP